MILLATRVFPLLALLTFLGTSVRAQENIAPEPPLNTRWTVNEDFTDQFNGPRLDDRKWFDYHPRWVGRPPAIFLPRAVSIVDGVLQIKNRKLAQDTTVTFFDGTTATYTIGGGAVVSQKTEAYHGYYEVRMKASDVRMSSTFWMSNPRTSGDCPNYSLELDVIEAIGGASPGLATFRTSMKSNTHYYLTDCNGNRQTFSQAGQGPIGGDASDAFHTYGCWWKNENEMIFYIDGEESHRIMANTGGSPQPFDRPMHVNMVTETYDFETPPSDADLADDNRNTTFYDFIHSFKMFDVDTPEPPAPGADGNLTRNGGFETGDFQEWIGWGGNPREVIQLDDAPEGDNVVHIANAGAPEQVFACEPNTDYTLTAMTRIVSGAVNLGVKRVNENVGIATMPVTGTEWERQTLNFNSGDNTELKFFFFAPAGANEGYADDFTLTGGTPPEEPEPALLLDESFRWSNLPEITPTSFSFNANFLFQANEERFVRIRMTDEAGNDLTDETTYNVLPGYGHKGLNFVLPEGIVDGQVIRLSAQMMTSDAEDATLVDHGDLVMTVNGTTVSTRDFRPEQLRVFPNPTSGLVRVDGRWDGKPYRVINTDGRLMRAAVLNGGEVDLTDLPVGIYHLLIDGRAHARIVRQ